MKRYLVMLILAACTEVRTAEIEVVFVSSSDSNGSYAKSLEATTKSGGGNRVTITVNSVGLRVAGGKVQLSGVVADPITGEVVSVVAMGKITDPTISVSGIPNGEYGCSLYLDDGNLVSSKKISISSSCAISIDVGSPRPVSGRIVGLNPFSPRSYMRINGLLYPIENDGGYKGATYGDLQTVELLYNLKNETRDWNGERYAIVFGGVKEGEFKIPTLDFARHEKILQVELEGPLKTMGWTKLKNRIPIKITNRNLGYSLVIAPDENGRIPLYGLLDGVCDVESAGLAGDYPILVKPGSVDLAVVKSIQISIGQVLQAKP
jgi:hypothetical protein